MLCLWDSQRYSLRQMDKTSDLKVERDECYCSGIHVDSFDILNWVWDIGTHEY